MKITLYTTTDCQFSKQEKEYLASHSLPFEEKNLETNKEFLTEMLAVSNNFAGTPVTKIEKDDGQISVFKGFTKEEFDKTLGFVSAPPAQPPTKPQEQLNSVLNDLQVKLNEPVPAATSQPTPTPTPPQPQNPTPPPVNLPSIPDFSTNQ